MKKLIGSLEEVYDYVLVDLPPLMPVVDVRSTTQLVDSYLFVSNGDKPALKSSNEHFRLLITSMKRSSVLSLIKPTWKRCVIILAKGILATRTGIISDTVLTIEFHRPRKSSGIPEVKGPAKAWTMAFENRARE